jgi:hypothetical protein
VSTISNSGLFAINHNDQPSSGIEQPGFSSLLLWTKKKGKMTGRTAARTGSHPLQKSCLEEQGLPSIYLCSSMALFGSEFTANLTFLVR